MALFRGKRDKDLPLLTQFYALQAERVQLPDDVDERLQTLFTLEVFQWLDMIREKRRLWTYDTRLPDEDVTLNLIEIHQWASPMMHSMANGERIPAGQIQLLKKHRDEISIAAPHFMLEKPQSEDFARRNEIANLTHRFDGGAVWEDDTGFLFTVEGCPPDELIPRQSLNFQRRPQRAGQEILDEVIVDLYDVLEDVRLHLAICPNCGGVFVLTSADKESCSDRCGNRVRQRGYYDEKYRKNLTPKP